MEKKGALVIILLVLSLFFISSIHAEDINLGTYDLNKTDNKVISTPQDLDTPQAPINEVRSLSASSNSVSDRYIISEIGEDYFNEHFNILGIEKRKFVQFYNYEFIYGDYNTTLFVAISDNDVIEDISHIIKTPQEIIFTDKSASDKASELGLEEPRLISLVYSDEKETLAWRVDWEHTPTDEEITNKAISGYLFSVYDGGILGTFEFQIDPKLKMDSENQITFSFLPVLIIGVIVLAVIIIFITYRRK